MICVKICKKSDAESFVRDKQAELNNSRIIRWHANIAVVVFIIYSTASKRTRNIFVTYDIPDL